MPPILNDRVRPFGWSLSLLLTHAIVLFSSLEVSAEDLASPDKPLAERVEEVIRPARDEFMKAKAVAQDKYKKVVDAELEKATKAGSLDDVKALQKEMEECAADESLWKSAAHKAAIKRYQADLQAPAKKFLAALDILIKDQVKKKNIELAEKIKEMKEGGLEGVRIEGLQRQVNLLSLIDPSMHSQVGKWSFKNGELVSPQDSHARLEIPYQPPFEYDFRIEFSLNEGGKEVTQILTHDGHAFAWELGSFGNTVFGFELVKGAMANSNASTVKKSSCLDNKTRYVSVVQVRKDGLKTLLNGAVITQYKTDYSDLSLDGSAYKMSPGLFLGVGSHQSTVIFHRIELLEVTGAGKRLP